MSAATDILAAIQTKIEATFAPAKCFTRRNSEKNPALAPAAADMTLPAFVASCNDGRPTEWLWAGVKGVTYTVELVYLTTELPGQRDASAAVESVIDQAANVFLKNRTTAGKPGLEGAPAVSSCKAEPLAPYDMPFGMKTANASRVRLIFETIETVP